MRRDHRQITFAVALAGVVALAGCGSTDTISGNTTATSALTTTPPTTEPAPSTSTSVPTESPTTTSTSTTTPAPTSSTVAPAPTTTNPIRPPGAPAPTTAIALVDSALVEIDVATGSVRRTIEEFFEGDGVFRYGLQRDPTGSTAWFGESYEDSWYACESSYGSFGRVDLTSGEISIVGVGSSPALSPDGRFVAYVASEVCVPDPENPESWVLTIADRVVVRDVATGDERVIVSSPTPDAYDSPTAVSWVGFGPDGDLFAMTFDQTMRRIGPDGSAPLQDQPVEIDAVVGFPLAATADGFITLEVGDEGSADLLSTDVGTGAATLLASSETFMSVAVSDGGHVLATASSPITVASGADVTVLEVAGDPFVSSVDW